MCMQCDTKPLSYGEIMPGVYLQRATKDSTGKEWLKGQLALVRMNDPDFIFSEDPFIDPLYGLSDKELDDLPVESLFNEENKKFDKSAEQVQEVLLNAGRVQLILDYAMAASKCIIDPFDVEKHGRFELWLCHRIARTIHDHNRIEDDLIDARIFTNTIVAEMATMYGFKEPSLVVLEMAAIIANRYAFKPYETYWSKEESVRQQEIKDLFLL